MGGGGGCIHYPGPGGVGKMSFLAKVLETKQWKIEKKKRKKGIFSNAKQIVYKLILFIYLFYLKNHFEFETSPRAGSDQCVCNM